MHWLTQDSCTDDMESVVQTTPSPDQDRTKLTAVGEVAVAVAGSPFYRGGWILNIFWNQNTHI